MAEQTLPGVVSTEVPSSEGVVGYIKGIGNYLARLTSSLFGGAAQVTMGAAKYARDVKSAVDPVIGEIGSTAKTAQDLSFLGSLADPNDVSGIRTFYDRSSSVLHKTQEYQSKRSPEIDRQLAESVLTPKQLRDRVQKAKLPPKRKKVKTANKPASKSSSKYEKPIYKGKIRISRRRH
jgi:hypothetical protein